MSYTASMILSVNLTHTVTQEFRTICQNGNERIQSEFKVDNNFELIRVGIMCDKSLPVRKVFGD